MSIPAFDGLSTRSAPSQTVLSPACAAGNSNPILPGYFADPLIVHFDGSEYIFSADDSWGGETLGRRESAGFKDLP